MKEHIKRVDRILKYKGSILDIYTDCLLYTSDAADE